MKVTCAAIFQNQELLKHLPNESSIYRAEVTAIDLAMNIIANHKSSKSITYSDSKSVLKTLQNKNTSTPLITRLLDKMDTLSEIIASFSPGYQVTLVYMEVQTNGIKVLQSDIFNIKIPYTDLKPITNKFIS